MSCITYMSMKQIVMTFSKCLQVVIKLESPGDFSQLYCLLTYEMSSYDF